MTDVFDPTTFAATKRTQCAATNLATFTDVRWDHSFRPPKGRPRGVKRLGLNYERRVLDVLSAIYGRNFTSSPVIAYRDGRVPRRALPDGLLYLDGQCVIIEVKLSHTPDVWDQLMVRYAPLVAALHPRLRVRTVEVCRSYDPAISIPHSLITSLHRGSVPGLEVLRWRI